MMEAAEPESGRDALAKKLGQLHAELRRLGTTQKAAVEEANQRRRAAAGRPKNTPWPRGEGGVDLSLTTVNDWFPKRTGSREPSRPLDFEDLWAVVVVMLEWTGQPADRRSKAGWKALHTEAQPSYGLDEPVRGYLEAARKAAEHHPYPGVPGRMNPPSLAEVYVRQRSRPTARDSHGLANRDDPAATRGDSALAAADEPAEVVFRTAERVCVLIAGPGGGKSTLLRTWLRAAAGEWLDGAQKASRAGAAIPVWVSARDLAEEKPISAVLADATRKLSRYGRDPELDKARFKQRPCTGANWQLLVDGLDELPTADERRTVLEKLANAVEDDPPYRCVIATRPLANTELDALDRALGYKAPRYYLQPFTPNDLRTYIGRFFGTQWPEEEAARRGQQFTDALRNASMAELARTPLMAFMHCQLYLHTPERPIPIGRTAVYEMFTDLVYDKNVTKEVLASHKEAIERLAGSVQTQSAREEAENAAEHVYRQLPKLIDYLAYQWHTGRREPATVTLATHEAVNRPSKVTPEEWEAFLEGLLRHTGLLVHHADGLDFIHQTFLEYHAARHATRDEGRRHTFEQLFHGTGYFPSVYGQIRQLTTDSSGQIYSKANQQARYMSESYFGFVLDGLLTANDDIAADTEQYLVESAQRRESISYRNAVNMLCTQFRLRTNLPNDVVCQLVQITEDWGEEFHRRVEVASALAEAVEEHRERIANLFISFAEGTMQHLEVRVRAASHLAEVEGYREDGVQLLISLAKNDTKVRAWQLARVWAADHVAGLEGYREDGAQLLISLVEDSRLDPWERNQAAMLVAEVQGYREYGAQLLISRANDTRLTSWERVRAAIHVAEMEGYREHGTDLLARLAEDRSIKAADRTWAAANAKKLAKLQQASPAGR